MMITSKKGIAPVAIILIILGVLVVVGGGVYVATQPGGFGALFGFGKSPTVVLKEAYEKTIKQSSAAINAGVNAKGKNTSGEGAQNVDMDVSLALNHVTFPSEDSTKTGDSEGAISFDGTVDGQAYKGSIAFKYLPPKIYFKINPDLKLPDIPLDPSFLSANWIFLDLEQKDGILAEAGSDIQQQIECRQNDNAKIQTYIKGLDFNKVMKDVSVGRAASLNGGSAVPYTITLDWDGLAAVGKEMAALNTCPKSEQELLFGPEEATPSTEPEEDWRDNIEEPKPVVWVDASSGLLSGIDLTIVPKKDFEGTVNVSLRLSDFNKPAQIDAPQDSVPVEQFIMSILLGGLMMGSPDAGFEIQAEE